MNSLRNKINDIRYLVSKLEPCVLALSEVKLDSSFPDSQFIVENYVNPGEYRKDRTKNGGGIIIFIKRGIPCQRLKRMEPHNLEVICIEITIKDRKWAIVSVYQTPNYITVKVFF